VCASDSAWCCVSWNLLSSHLLENVMNAEGCAAQFATNRTSCDIAIAAERAATLEHRTDNAVNCLSIPATLSVRAPAAGVSAGVAPSSFADIPSTGALPAESLLVAKSPSIVEEESLKPPPPRVVELARLAWNAALPFGVCSPDG
jgi:hypothetical protein